MLLEVSTPNVNAFSIENLSKSSTEDKRTLIIGNQHAFNTMRPLPPLLPIQMSQNYGNTNTHFTKTEMNPTSVTLKRKRDDSSSDDNEKEVKRAPSRESCMSRETPSPSSSSQGDSDPDHTPTRSSKKKSRTTFSSQQIQGLETAYEEQKYLSATDRSVLAKKLQLSDQQVKTWFQNRRMKEKRQEKEEDQPKGVQIPTGGVDISQLAALGLPCPPPPIVTQKNGGPLPQRMQHANVQMPLSPNPSLKPTSDIQTHAGQLPSMYSPFFPGYPFINGYGYQSPPLFQGYPMHAMMSPLRMGQTPPYVNPGMTDRNEK